MFERSGIATVTLTSALDITERARPPRAAFLDYPLGNQAGPPGRPDLQREILTRALELLHSAREPGSIARLPFEWPEPGWREAVVATYRADAGTVLSQRRESEYDETGDYFAARDCNDVCSLV